MWFGLANKVAAEAKLVDVAWEKKCVEEKVECAPGYGAPAPPPASPGYGPPPPPAYCREKIKVRNLFLSHLT